ncbi:MAG: S8 family serine peptidase [Pseudomonadota bacterium]
MIKRSISIAVWLSIVFAAVQAGAETKVDPYLDSYPLTKAIKASSIGLPAGAERPVDIFIKSSDIQKTRDAVAANGGSVHTVIGDILTATVDAASIAAIAQGGDVVFVEGAKPLHTKNDMAVAEINASDVHSGAGLTSAYTGSGVIVGLLDTGIDYRHPDFADAQGKNRVLAIWDQNSTSGPGPAEIENTFGTECLAKSIADGTCRFGDADGHGTHVAGIMAGNNARYGGVAPDANIIAVNYDSSLDLETGYADTIFSSKICQGAYYVFEKAKALGMPAVVNLSLGTHIGPHDGSSLFEQCLAGLVHKQAGRAIVAAAGNEYYSETNFTGIHAGGAVNGTAAVNFVIRQVSHDLIYYIDLWGSKGSAFSAGLAIHKGDPSGYPLDYSNQVEAGNSKSGSFLDGNISYIINTSETASSLNGKPHVGVTIVLNRSVASPSQYSFDLVIGGKGSFDAWAFPDKPSRTIEFTSSSGDLGAGWSFIAGDRAKSIAVPATSPDIIAVAGYATRNKWDNEPGCCQVTFEIGNILDFSSSGPSANSSATGQKPDLAAPGGMIASALSSTAKVSSQLLLPDKQHVMQAGTSMSAPFVSGSVALIFSANHNFTSEDVKGYLVKSAYVDSMVGSVPNNRWGYGKLDTLAAMEAAIKGGASGSFDSNQTPLQPASAATASSSHGGCSLAPSTASSADELAAMALAIAVLSIALARRRVKPLTIL